MIERALIPLLAGCVIFAAAIVVELGSGESDEPAVALPAARAQAVTSPRTPPTAVEELVATSIARPLFNATRRPVEKASPTGAPDPELPDVRLSGIVVEPNRHLAIFAVSGGKPLVRSEGESLKDWRLDSIGPNEVSLSGPGGLRTLAPKTDPNLVRPAPAVAAAPAGAPGHPARPAAIAQPTPPAGRPPAIAAAAPPPAPARAAPGSPRRPHCRRREQRCTAAP